MLKYYDILQVRNIIRSLDYLANLINVDKRELRRSFGIGTVEESIQFLEYCGNRNFSATRIIARKMNDIAKQHNLMIRFVPEDDSWKKEEIYGI